MPSLLRPLFRKRRKLLLDLSHLSTIGYLE